MNNPGVKKNTNFNSYHYSYIGTVPIYEKQSVDSSWNDEYNTLSRKRSQQHRIIIVRRLDIIPTTGNFTSLHPLLCTIVF